MHGHVKLKSLGSLKCGKIINKISVIFFIKFLKYKQLLSELDSLPFQILILN
jgi:hypothetical protein